MNVNLPHSAPKKDKRVQIKDSLCPDLTVGGIGIDIADISRMRDRFSRQCDLAESLFTPSEIAYCQATADPAASFAAGFALKEAFLKALGTGWQHGIGFREIEIGFDADGCVSIKLKGRAAELGEQRGVRAIHASVSAADGLAVATVLVEVINGKG